MSQPLTGTWEWIARATGVIGLCAAAYAVGAKIFSYVTRTELANLMASQDAKFLSAQATMKADVDAKFEQHRCERQRIADEARAETIRLHEENRETFGQIFARTAGIAQAQARIEGRIDGALSGTHKMLPAPPP